jgi:bacterial/archaeal transporter family protein
VVQCTTTLTREGLRSDTFAVTMAITSVKRANWFGLTLAAVGLWGLYGLAFKLASDRLSALSSQWLSSVGLLLPAVFLVRPVFRERSSTRGLMFGFVSGLCGCMGNFALLVSLRQGGQASVVFPLTALYPLVTVIVASVFLYERVRAPQAAGISIAIIAVVFLSLDANVSFSNLRMTVGFSFPSWLLWAAGALIAFGLAAVFQKLATNRVPAEAAFVTFAAGFIPCVVLIPSFEPLPNPLAAMPVFWAVAGGLLNGLGVVATLAAYRRGGKASLVTPLAAIYPVITVLLALIFLGEKLVVAQIIGIVLATVGGILMAQEP